MVAVGFVIFLKYFVVVIVVIEVIVAKNVNSKIEKYEIATATVTTHSEHIEAGQA